MSRHARAPYQESAFLHLADTAPVMIWISDLSRGCTYFNKRWLEFTGRTMEQEIGNGWSSDVHAEDFDHCLNTYVDCFDRHEPFQMEYRLRRHDGLYRWVLDSGIPRYSARGVFEGFVGTCIDITERVESQQMLRRGNEELEHRIADRTAELWRTIDRLKISQENLRVLFNSVHDAIVLHDVDGNVIDVNDKMLEMYGVTSEEALQYGMMNDYSAPGSDVQTLQGYWQDVLAGEDRVFECKARRPKDGSVFEAEVFLRKVPLHDRDAILATVRDITRRKALERELVQARRMEMVQTVVGGIAHDFNNILNNVLGFAYLLKKYADDRERTLKYGEVIEQSVRKGTALADRLLSLSSGKATSLSQQSVPSLIGAAVERFRKHCKDAPTVEIKSGGKFPKILGDEEAIIEGIVHVLVNAREAMHSAHTELPAITIATGYVSAGDASLPAVLQQHSCVVISISDNGPGIPQSIYDRMFEPFVSTKSPGQAAGLGLAVVYATIRGCGGMVTADPPSGQGACIRFWLPNDIAANRTGPEQVSNEATKTGHEMILLVDDEQAMLAFAKDILEDRGYRVLTASNGAEALDLYRSRSAEIDLVVLDLIMPVMDGGQAYLEMKKIRDDVRAFFCSGYTSDQVITSLLREHGLTALRKPFEVTQFLSTVREVLDEK